MDVTLSLVTLPVRFSSCSGFLDHSTSSVTQPSAVQSIASTRRRSHVSAPRCSLGNGVNTSRTYDVTASPRPTSLARRLRHEPQVLQHLVVQLGGFELADQIGRHAVDGRFEPFVQPSRRGDGLGHLPQRLLFDDGAVSADVVQQSPGLVLAGLQPVSVFSRCPWKPCSTTRGISRSFDPSAVVYSSSSAASKPRSCSRCSRWSMRNVSLTSNSSAPVSSVHSRW